MFLDVRHARGCESLAVLRVAQAQRVAQRVRDPLPADVEPEGRGEPALGTDPSKVRDAVASALFPMTIKGYLGDSVKARAVDLKEAGQDEKAGALKRERLAVLKALNAVDTYCFEQQTGKQPSGAPPAEVKAQLEAAVSSLDSVITQAVAARELLGS